MSNARPGTGLQLFDVAADFAKAMGYRDADDAWCKVASEIAAGGA